MIDVEKARHELDTKTKAQIEAEAAELWAGRCIAAYERLVGTKDLTWLAAAVDYEREALEHAVFGNNLSSVMNAIYEVKTKLGVRYFG